MQRLLVDLDDGHFTSAQIHHDVFALLRASTPGGGPSTRVASVRGRYERPRKRNVQTLADARSLPM